MVDREIVWTKTAALQRRLIFEYWIDRTGSTEYSQKLLYESKERTEQLKLHPLSGKKAAYPDTRVVSLGHYSIFYKLLNDNIVITAFWDNRQNPEKLLKALQSKI
jgi:plasmid stabilization system protein ParE